MKHAVERAIARCDVPSPVVGIHDDGSTGLNTRIQFARVLKAGFLAIPSVTQHRIFPPRNAHRVTLHHNPACQLHSAQTRSPPGYDSAVFPHLAVHRRGAVPGEGPQRKFAFESGHLFAPMELYKFARHWPFHAPEK